MGATDTMYIGEDNTINIRDHAICEDDCRAPIFYHSTNTTYYVRPGSSSKFASDIFIDGNYGVGIVGVYASTRYQHVWSMGAAYRTNAAGTSYGNMYGLTYTHTNVGTGTNQSIAGLSHQLQHRTNGTLTAAIGSGIWTSGNVTAYSDIAVKTVPARPTSNLFFTVRQSNVAAEPTMPPLRKILSTFIFAKVVVSENVMDDDSISAYNLPYM